jgi:hypothetical protein
MAVNFDPPVLSEPVGFDSSRVVDSRVMSYLILREHWKLVTSALKAIQSDWVAGPDHGKGLFASEFSLGDWKEELDGGWFTSGGDVQYFVPEPFAAPADDGVMVMGEYSLYPTDGTQLGASSMVTSLRAAECAFAHMSKIALRLYSSMKRRNSYRSFLVTQKTGYLAERAVQRLYEQIMGIQKPQNPPTGPRFLSVRNWRYGIGWGKHCWRPASHRRVGRKSHPGWRWLELNAAKNKKRRKTNRPYRFKRRKPAKPRPTRHQRPIHPDGV